MDVEPERTPVSVALAELARADPHRMAITDHLGGITRAELDARSNQLARVYADHGVGQGAMVTIGLGNGIAWFIATIAAWKVGATPQPVSHRLPRRELEAIIELVRPALIVGLDPPAGLDIPVLADDFRVPAEISTAALEPRIAPSVKAPTSGGSTGRPKVIISTDEATAETITDFARLVAIPRDGVQLVTGPLYHNGPLISALCALFLGNHLVVMPRFDAAEALRLIGEHQVDWLYLVPTMMHRIARLPARPDVSSLRTVLSMGAACPEWLKQFWIDWLGGDRVLELYASTEAQAGTVITGAEWLAHRGSVGRPVFGEIVARDAQGNPLPPGTVGQLWMRRDAEVSGRYRYLGAQPEQGGQHWESVGDLGWFDEDGYLYLADRMTDMIVVGGANVYPAEVEAAIEEHNSVESAAVIGLPDDEYGNTVHAIVHTTSEVTDTELFDFLKERLVAYKLPRSIERSATALRDDAGKLRRSRLRAERLSQG